MSENPVDRRPLDRAPEMVGPAHARIDVSRELDRALTLRALNGVMVLSHETEERFAKVFGDLAELLGRTSRNSRHLSDTMMDVVTRISRIEHHLVERGGIADILIHPPSPDTAPDSPGLPPMRPRYASTHEEARAVSIEIAQRIDAETRNPSTPSPPPPETMVKISEDVLQMAMDRIKAANWDRLEAERKDREAERVEAERKASELAAQAKAAEVSLSIAREKAELAIRTAKRKAWIRFSLASGLALLSAVGWAIEHFKH